MAKPLQVCDQVGMRGGSPSSINVVDVIVGLCDWVWSWWSIGHRRNRLCFNANSVGVDSARLHKEGVGEFGWKALPGPLF